MMMMMMMMMMMTLALGRVEAERHRASVLRVYPSFGDSLHKNKHRMIRKVLRIRISDPVERGLAHV